jgi:hypothetical protein
MLEEDAVGSAVPSQLGPRAHVVHPDTGRALGATEAPVEPSIARCVSTNFSEPAAARLRRASIPSGPEKPPSIEEVGRQARQGRGFRPARDVTAGRS